MYSDILNRIREQAHAYGESLQPPAKLTSIEALKTEVHNEFSLSLPGEYVNFLSKLNGMDWNGLVIYSCKKERIEGYSDRFIEGFVEANRSYRDSEPMHNYLVFGEDGDSLYTYCISEDSYQVVTTVGLTVLESFATFDELLVNALEAHA